jgi:hypothetical protein
MRLHISYEADIHGPGIALLILLFVLSRGIKWMNFDIFYNMLH